MADWLSRIELGLRLGQGGTLLLVTGATPAGLRRLLVRLLPSYPDLQVLNGIAQLGDVPTGGVVILQPRLEEAEWMNQNRPYFQQRALRMILWCEGDVAAALYQRAPDFFDWKSQSMECPAEPPLHAVSGLRALGCSRRVGAVYEGDTWRDALRACAPGRSPRIITAALSYDELVGEVAGAGRDLLVFTDVDGEFRMRRVRWALAEARWRRPSLVLCPAGMTLDAPGWWHLHGRHASLEEACVALRAAPRPGVLAGLLALEPEAIELCAELLSRGWDAAALEQRLIETSDPGALVAQVLQELDPTFLDAVVSGAASPPLPRGLWSNRDVRALQQRHRAELAKKLADDDRITVQDAGEAAAWLRPMFTIDRAHRARDRAGWILAELVLRREVRAQDRLWLVRCAVTAGDLQVLARWSLGMPGGEDPASHAASLHELARVSQALGKYPEAQSLLRQSLTLTEKALGKDHPGYGASLHALAGVLQHLGKYQEAESLLRQSLLIYEKALGKDHPDYGASLHALAGVLQHLGKYQEAESLLHQSLTLKEKALGKDHPDYGASLHELAGVLQSQGKYQEAESLLRQSLALYEKALGKDHPDYGASLHALAGVLQHLGKYQEAESLLRQSLALYEKALGKDHPDYGASLHELAGLLPSLGKYQEAESLLRQSLALKERALGKDHPDYGASLHELARVLQYLGKYQEAKSLLRQSLALKEKALGKDHPSLCPSLSNLALLFTQMGRSEEGEPLAVRALAIAQKAYGQRHPDVAHILGTLAQIHEGLHHPQAAETARQALQAYRDTLGPAHPWTRDIEPVLQRIIEGGAR